MNKLKDMKLNFSYLIIVIVVLTLMSCGKSPEDTGRTFIPDMQYSSAYEPYSEGPQIEGSTFKNGASARKPVEGTIPRGHIPYHYSNNMMLTLKSQEKIGTLNQIL